MVGAEEVSASFLGVFPVERVVTSRSQRSIRGLVVEVGGAILEGGLAVELALHERQQSAATLVECRPSLVTVDSKTLVNFFVEVVEDHLSRLRKAVMNLVFEIGLELGERPGDVFLGSALLVDLGDTAFDVDAGLEGAEHLVAGSEDPVEEVEILR